MRAAAPAAVEQQAAPAVSAAPLTEDGIMQQAAPPIAAVAAQPGGGGGGSSSGGAQAYLSSLWDDVYSVFVLSFGENFPQGEQVAMRLCAVLGQHRQPLLCSNENCQLPLLPHGKTQHAHIVLLLLLLNCSRAAC